jgi:hypothetical protein
VGLSTEQNLHHHLLSAKSSQQACCVCVSVSVLSVCVGSGGERGNLMTSFHFVLKDFPLPLSFGAEFYECDTVTVEQVFLDCAPWTVRITWEFVGTANPLTQ